jgi:hypothetical protein
MNVLRWFDVAHRIWFDVAPVTRAVAVEDVVPVVEDRTILRTTSNLRSALSMVGAPEICTGHLHCKPTGPDGLIHLLAVFSRAAMGQDNSVLSVPAGRRATHVTNKLNHALLLRAVVLAAHGDVEGEAGEGPLHRSNL